MRYEKIFVNFILILYYIFLLTLDPSSSYLFLALSIMGFFLKFLLIKVILDRTLFKMRIKFRLIEVIIYFISLYYILQNFDFLIYSFGIFNLIVFILCYSIGYFLNFEKRLL